MDNIIKDTHCCKIAQLASTVESLNQQARCKSMLMHGVQDIAALSKSAVFKCFAKGKLDEANRGRGPSFYSSQLSHTWVGLARPTNLCWWNKLPIKASTRHMRCHRS